MTLYKIWIEWDVGQEDLVFTSKKKARDWLASNDTILDMFKGYGDEEPEFKSVKDIEDAGLCGYTKLEVI